MTNSGGNPILEGTTTLSLLSGPQSHKECDFHPHILINMHTLLSYRSQSLGGKTQPFCFTGEEEFINCVYKIIQMKTLASTIFKNFFIDLLQ